MAGPRCSSEARARPPGGPGASHVFITQGWVPGPSWPRDQAGEQWALRVFGERAAGRGGPALTPPGGGPAPGPALTPRAGGPAPGARTHSTRGRPRPRARTHSTRAHRAQATAPQLQQVRTQRAHRARSHWPHAAFPSTARTHDEQALDATPAGSVRKKHGSVQW